MTRVVIIDQSNREMVNTIGQEAGIRILTEPKNGNWWISWEADPDVRKCIVQAITLCMHQGKEKLTVCVFDGKHKDMNSVVFTGHSDPTMAWRSICVIEPECEGEYGYMNVSSFPNKEEAEEDVEEWLNEDEDFFEGTGMRFGRVLHALRDE